MLCKLNFRPISEFLTNIRGQSPQLRPGGVLHEERSVVVVQELKTTVLLLIHFLFSSLRFTILLEFSKKRKEEKAHLITANDSQQIHSWRYS